LRNSPASAAFRRTPSPPTGADLQKVAQFLGDNGLREWRSLDQFLLEELLARCHEQALDIRSQQRLLSSLRGFYDWLARRGDAAFNPARASA